MRLNFGVIAFDLVGALVDDSIVFETVDDPSVRDTEAVMSDGFDQFHRQRRTQRLLLVVRDQMCGARINRCGLAGLGGEFLKKSFHLLLDETEKDSASP